METRPTFLPVGSVDYECARVYPSVFTPGQCDRIIEHASDFATDVGQVGATPGLAEHDQEIRLSRIAWIPAEEPFAWIFEKLAGVVRRANRVYDFDLIGFTEDLQYTEYDGAGAHYVWHQDGLDGELAVRKLSLVVQLSDPDGYDGCDLEFFAMHGEDAVPDWTAKLRRRGSVIVFPSYEFHRVTPLLSGIRRSLVSWVGGPPFR